MNKEILKYIKKYSRYETPVSFEAIAFFMIENKINHIAKHESKNQLVVYFTNSKQEEFCRTYMVEDVSSLLPTLRIMDRKIK